MRVCRMYPTRDSRRPRIGLLKSMLPYHKLCSNLDGIFQCAGFSWSTSALTEGGRSYVWNLMGLPFWTRNVPELVLQLWPWSHFCYLVECWRYWAEYLSSMDLATVDEQQCRVLLLPFQQACRCCWCQYRYLVQQTKCRLMAQMCWHQRLYGCRGTWAHQFGQLPRV